MPRTKTITDIRSAARGYTNTCLNVLRGIMTDKNATHAARVTAALGMLDRGWGRPHQTSEMTVKRVTARELSDDELAVIAAGSGDGDSISPPDSSELH